MDTPTQYRWWVSAKIAKFLTAPLPSAVARCRGVRGQEARGDPVGKEEKLVPWALPAWCGGRKAQTTERYLHSCRHPIGPLVTSCHQQPTHTSTVISCVSLFRRHWPVVLEAQRPRSTNIRRVCKGRAGSQKRAANRLGGVLCRSLGYGRLNGQAMATSFEQGAESQALAKHKE
jgi:hypothetical protein